MQITLATEYAVRCALYLALHGGERTIPRREIAEAMEIPEQFLAKIAQRLARAGVLKITQGARGGYRLLEPPGSLTLLEVVEAAEGGICLNQCVLNPRICSRSCSCSVHEVWARVRQQLRDTLGGVTFADLAAAEASCDAGRPSRRGPRRSARPAARPANERR
jgi:Rrf2 family protein